MGRDKRRKGRTEQRWQEPCRRWHFFPPASATTSSTPRTPVSRRGGLHARGEYLNIYRSHLIRLPCRQFHRNEQSTTVAPPPADSTAPPLLSSIPSARSSASTSPRPPPLRFPSSPPASPNRRRSCPLGRYPCSSSEPSALPLLHSCAQV